MIVCDLIRLKREHALVFLGILACLNVRIMHTIDDLLYMSSCMSLKMTNMIKKLLRHALDFLRFKICVIGQILIGLITRIIIGLSLNNISPIILKLEIPALRLLVHLLRL